MVRGLADIGAEGILLAGAGRAILLQIADPRVGHGVADHSDFAQRPQDRLRATLTYVYAIVYGSDEQVAAVRRAVNRAHAPVRRNPDDATKGYNAFDPESQLWVVATLYDTAVTVYEQVHGPLDDETADRMYRDYARIGTALQLPANMWPPDRVAFDEFWKRSLDELRIDPPVREHLHGVAAMAFLPAPLRLLAGRFNLFATAGFLPTEFRAHMQLPWTSGQQRRFEWLLTALRITDRVIPRDVWILGYRLYLWDMRVRARRGTRTPRCAASSASWSWCVGSPSTT